MIGRLALIHTLQSAGLQVAHIEVGRLIRCKTVDDKGQQKSGWYRVFDDARRITAVYGCWRTGERGVWVSGDNQQQTPEQRVNDRRLLDQAKQERQQKQARQWGCNHAKLLALWGCTAPITKHDPAGQYMINRGLTIPDTNVLRFHRGLDYWHDGQCLGQFPAMLAAVTAPTGGLITVHRTFLTPDGRKADVPTVKKLCSPAGVMGGASIKIGLPATRSDGRLGLGIAEGIETALAASILFGVPVWAGVSANGLRDFAPPLSVRNVYVFGDNDVNQTGQKAAEQLAERLTRSGFTVRTHIPLVSGDWHDELIMKGVTA